VILFIAYPRQDTEQPVKQGCTTRSAIVQPILWYWPIRLSN